jgi:nucleoside-specific outer membrane channel protein Tsx
MNFNKILTAAAIAATVSTAAISTSASAEIWSNTEVQLQAGGEFEHGFGEQSTGTITTFQHAGGWEYGDNFFFVDHSQYSGKGSRKDTAEFYGEWYSNFSLGAITGNDLSFGPVKDIGLVAGFNYAPEVDSAWVLPGMRLALDLPGFAFAQVDITAFIHASGADSSLAGDFSAPFSIIDEESSFMVDFAWAYPFKIGSTSWSIEGHLEYMDGREQTNNFGTTQLESWVLFQPQIRMDLGELIGTPSQRLFVGIEYQYWKNKLGMKGVDDNTAQFLAVWRF